MPKHLVWLALCACFGLSACATFQTPHQAAAKARANWRWIGIRKTDVAKCPTVPGWKMKPLFDPELRPPIYPEQKGYDQQHYLDEKQAPGKPSTAEVIRELDRFCLYESEKKKVRGLPSVVRAAMEKVDKDCAAISSSADLTEADLERASGRLLSHAGRPSTPLEINNRLGVRLAFLDTQPTGMGASTAPGNSHHGYTLTHIARNLVCSSETSNSPVPNNRCAAQITTRLALPIVRFDAKHPKLTKTDFVRGGYIGMQGDLAQAITNEVDDWRRERAQKHLVLNLSVAWDGQLFDGLKTERIDELQAGTQAIYQALRYAKSLDVLVVAAAGNRKDHCPQSMTGPLLPAAWDDLVYAVGGVRSNGNPLLNARPGGMPLLAAYGENAGVTSWNLDRLDLDRYTAFYTGSSVAAAVASSIAAVVWDSFPDRTPRQVIDILYRSGDELLGFAPNFGFLSDVSTAKDLKAHRLSLCTALRLACDERKTSESCPLGATACPSWTPEEPVSLASAPSARSAAKSCYPWMHPQPDDPPCLNCHEPPPK